MRVTVIGAGAIGGWLAATLAKGGAEVALVARGATLDRLREHGLTVLQGDRRDTYRLAAADRAQDLPQARCRRAGREDLRASPTRWPMRRLP